jgi:hypothetical protein
MEIYAGEDALAVSYAVLAIGILLELPVQRTQTCSAGLKAASGLAPRGSFCIAPLTAT